MTANWGLPAQIIALHRAIRRTRHTHYERCFFFYTKLRVYVSGSSLFVHLDYFTLIMIGIKKIYIISFLAFLICFKGALGQEYSYTHYDLKDGLAGSTVYCMAEDKEGFLWFGTETGLSRFDGTRFSNFTTQNGLPDNDVLNVFADNKGRIWLATFKAAVCYYYKGKLYTQENDSLLKQIKLKTFIKSISEDDSGNILLLEDDALHLVTYDGRLKDISSVSDNVKPNFIRAGARSGGGFWIYENQTLYEWINGQFRLNKKLPWPSAHEKYSSFTSEMIVYRSLQDTAVAMSLKSGNQIKAPLNINSLNSLSFGDSLFASCTRTGLYLYNLNKPSVIKHFLPNQPVSYTMVDKENNWWFCTLGQGIYKLNSEGLRNISLQEKDGNTSVISCITEKNGTLMLGTERNLIHFLRFEKDSILQSTFRSVTIKGFVPVVDIKTLPNGDLIIGYDVTLIRVSSDHQVEEYIINDIAAKKIFLKNSGEILVATSRNLLLIDPHDFRKKSIIWPERLTTVYAKGDTIFIGTLNGLYRMEPDGSSKFLGDKIPELKSRITSIAEDKNGTLWIATYGNGVIGYRDQRLIAHIIAQEGKGLTSNICKTLFLKGEYLWVGTDKGLNKIHISGNTNFITKFTTADGLSSDNINAIYVNDSVVFLGSNAGLTYFNEKYIAGESICKLRMTGLRISDQNFTPDSTNFTLPHSMNNIRFDYVGISYRSAGDIQYNYRLLGLDTAWKQTREMFLSYPTLPSGEYTMQIQAINKFNVRSEILSVKFAVNELLREKTWFRVLLAIVVLGFILLLLRYFNSRVRKRETEKSRITSRISELEQLSLKSQMNPHFIFNSLNSIQQYVMDKDIAGANRFISGFSKLIRQTLDFSSKPLVPLADEIGYLKTYLELEKNRLEDKFTFQVSVAEELMDTDHQVPPMILQPYLENSLRHGIRFRKDNDGRISVRVNKLGDRLICIIEDNGVGRKLAAQYKSNNPIEYQSKGMKLTADRLELINQNIKNKIEVHIDDIEFENGAPAGTRVTVSFPEEYV